MERRRANTLAAERDPAAAEIVHELAGWGLRRLSDELARLDATLAEGPDDVPEALRTTVRPPDAVLTRRQAWAAGAATPRPRRRSQRPPLPVGRELDRIEHEIATLAERIDTLPERPAQSSRGRNCCVTTRRHGDAVTERPRPRRRRQLQPLPVGLTLGRIGHELATLEGRSDRRRALDAERLEFRDARRGVVERWRLVHRAMQAEERRVRIEA